MLAGCAKKHHGTAAAPAAPAPPASRSPQPIRSGETGLASWYGHPYHGRPAANGEIYDMESFTAAHRTLPFGTWVRVVNLTNDKTVDVRITDRGPFVENRIIDVSHAAAGAIGLIGPGVARVRLDILSVPAIASTQSWYAVQAGAFHHQDRAERARRPGTRVWIRPAGSPSQQSPDVARVGGTGALRSSRECHGPAHSPGRRLRVRGPPGSRGLNPVTGAGPLVLGRYPQMKWSPYPK